MHNKMKYLKIFGKKCGVIVVLKIEEIYDNK